MNRKMTALLLSALVLPGLGQLYIGRKALGGIIIVLINLILLLAVFVLLKGLSPLIASQIAAGAVIISPSEVMQGFEGVSGFGKAVLAAFFLVWAFSVVDIIRSRGEE
jgi:TM2 domain-containing membrane protein YozV